MLVKLCAFLSSLHWPTVLEDLGISGISYAELLIVSVGLERGFS